MRSKNEELLRGIVESINDSYLQGEDTPSLKEIADEFDISVPTASRYIAELTSRGELERDGRYGNLRTPKITNINNNVIRCPILGAIACGTPMLAEENIESYVTLSKNIFGNGKFFILRANGNSMINAGIDNGDLVVVRQQETAVPGQIIVALVDNEVTLKRYFVDKRKRKIRLHPENDDMEDIYCSSVAIQGVAVKVIKDLK